MWILYALGAAFFSGLTSVLCKAGVDDVDSEVSTTIRTLVILFISFIVTFYNCLLLIAFHEIVWSNVYKLTVQ